MRALQRIAELTQALGRPGKRRDGLGDGASVGIARGGHGPTPIRELR